MEAAFKICVEEFFNLTESSNGNSIRNSSTLIQRIKRRRNVLLASNEPRQKRKVPKNVNFWEVISKMPDDVFSSHFRMKIGTFKALKNMLEPLWPKRITARPCLPLTKSMYVTLWKLSNQNSFRELSDRFGIGAATAYRSFIKTLNVILLLRNKIIAFPSTPITQKVTIEQFRASRAIPFPSVLGCIDGTHIRISQPVKDSISYHNRKGTFSIIVQAIVDSKMRFIDAFVGYPGRCHDASVWHNSPIRKAIISKTIKISPECHLLGDGAYPLEIFLMTPYKDNGYLTSEQKKFNYVLSSTRVFVEQAFGILKKKFRILNYIELQNIALAKKIIMACLILHNCIIDNEILNVDDMESMDENISLSVDITDNTRAHSQKEEAKRKRIELTRLISA